MMTEYDEIFFCVNACQGVNMLGCVLQQDLALYNEFTISDTLTFFGRIHGLSSKDTQARVNFLVDFLDLPQKNRLVRNLR